MDWLDWMWVNEEQEREEMLEMEYNDYLYYEDLEAEMEARGLDSSPMSSDGKDE